MVFDPTAKTSRRGRGSPSFSLGVLSMGVGVVEEGCGTYFVRIAWFVGVDRTISPEEIDISWAHFDTRERQLVGRRSLT